MPDASGLGTLSLVPVLEGLREPVWDGRYCYFDSVGLMLHKHRGHQLGHPGRPGHLTARGDNWARWVSKSRDPSLRAGQILESLWYVSVICKNDQVLTRFTSPFHDPRPYAETEVGTFDSGFHIFEALFLLVTS